MESSLNITKNQQRNKSISKCLKIDKHKESRSNSQTQLKLFKHTNIYLYLYNKISFCILFVCKFYLSPSALFHTHTKRDAKLLYFGLLFNCRDYCAISQEIKGSVHQHGLTGRGQIFDNRLHQWKLWFGTCSSESCWEVSILLLEWW